MFDSKLLDPGMDAPVLDIFFLAMPSQGSPSSNQNYHESQPSQSGKPRWVRSEASKASAKEHRASLAAEARHGACVTGRQDGAADGRTFYEGIRPEIDKMFQTMLTILQAPPEGAAAAVTQQHDASWHQPTSLGEGLLTGQRAHPPDVMEVRLLKARELAHHSEMSWRDIVPYQPPFLCHCRQG